MWTEQHRSLEYSILVYVTEKLYYKKGILDFVSKSAASWNLLKKLSRYISYTIFCTVLFYLENTNMFVV